MKNVDNIDIESLLGKPLWQLTGQEFCVLTQYANAQGGHTTVAPGTVRITGVRALAIYLGCCESTIFMLRRNGVLDEAIISQIGKKIVFDGDKARVLAYEFQKNRRGTTNE